MPVESATYVNQLVATNPLHTDGLDEADSHMRLTKAVLLNTFPNVGGATTCSDADLNGITGLVDLSTGVLTAPAPTTANGTLGSQIILEGASGQPNIMLSNQGGSLAISYEGTTLTVPSAPTLSSTTGGSIAAATFYAKITYVSAAGETTPSGETSLAVAANKLLVVASPAAQSGATGWNVYVSSATGTEKLQNTSPIAIGTSWTEPTSGVTTNGGSPPTTNTASTTTTWTSMLSLSTSGALTVPGAISAGSFGNTLPVGVIMMWSGAISTIPSGWHLCDGTTGTPNLSGSFVVHADGTEFVPGQTGGSFSPTATTSTVAAHNHGGADGAAGGYTPTGVTDSQGAHSHGGAVAGTALSVAQLPAHVHQEVFTVASGGSAPQGSGGFGVGPGFISPDITTASTGQGAVHSHTISSDGTHQHNLVVSAVPNHQHTISSDGSHSHTVTTSALPPYYALAYIMKIS